MDADDVSAPRRLEWQVEFLQAHPRVGVVGGAITVIDEGGRRLFDVVYPATPDAVRAALEAGTALAHPAVTFRRDTLHACGGYRASFLHAEDFDLWLRMAELVELTNLERAVLQYRFHPASVSAGHLEQQVVSMVAAQISAAQRRRGAGEPLALLSPVTLCDVLGQDAPRAYVLGLIVEHAAGRAAFSVRVGQANAALQLLDWAGRYADRTVSSRSVAKAALVRALALRRLGRNGASVRAALVALQADPLYSVKAAAIGGRLLIAR
jgi:hypothetical protein